MNNKSYYSIIAFIVSFQFIVFTSLFHYYPDKLPINQWFIDFITGVLITIVSYIVYFIHEIVNTSNTYIVQRDLFDLFIYPLFEEGIKLLFIIYKYHDGITLFNIYFLSLGYYISSTQLYFYCPHDYNSYYQQFLRLYDVWLYQDNYKYNHNNHHEVQYLISNIMNDEDEDDEASPFDITHRHSICTHDSQKTLYSANSLSPKKLSGKKLPTEFNLHQSIHDSQKESSSNNKLVSTAMSISKSTDTTFSVEMLKNYQSCSDFVDKLYSVSPRNTYHLNTATAIATFEDFGGEDPHSSGTVIINKINEPIEQVECTLDDHDDDDDDENHDSSSIHTNGTHFGGGGGGNFKFKLPNGPKIEFGGGAGFDYSHDDPSSSSTTATTPLTNTPSKFITFINWFKWLFPVILPLGKQPEPPMVQFQGERYPLLKHRLSNYNLQQGNSNPELPPLETEGRAEFRPILDRFSRFQYFILYNYHVVVGQVTSRINVDPVFKRFGQLITEVSPIFILMNEMNEYIWQWIVLIIFGFRVWWIVLCVFIIKLFKNNYLFGIGNGFDYRLVICLEGWINLLLGIYCIYLYLV